MRISSIDDKEVVSLGKLQSSLASTAPDILSQVPSEIDLLAQQLPLIRAPAQHQFNTFSSRLLTRFSSGFHMKASLLQSIHGLHKQMLSKESCLRQIILLAMMRSRTQQPLLIEWHKEKQSLGCPSRVPTHFIFYSQSTKVLTSFTSGFNLAPLLHTIVLLYEEMSRPVRFQVSLIRIPLTLYAIDSHCCPR